MEKIRRRLKPITRDGTSRYVLVIRMQRPQPGDELTLLNALGKTTAIRAEGSHDRAHSGGTLLRVMARGLFAEGQPFRIAEQAGSRIGAIVQNVAKQIIDREVLLAAICT